MAWWGCEGNGRWRLRRLRRNNYRKGNLILTHWGQATHICISKFTIIGSGNGLSTGRRQAIIWSNARILLIRTSGTNFSEIFIKIDTFSFKKMHFNSLGPGDAIWQQRSGSPLAQVIAWCLTAPTHYLNQCWLIISKVEWHSSKGKLTRDTSAINHWNHLEN